MVLKEPTEAWMPGDPNRYHLGLLPSADPRTPHRVVTAVQAHDGTRGAASICTDLLRSFPDVQCIVFAGIAAGIPQGPEHVVALGDIVVATGGLVDYGHVRLEKGRESVRRGVDGMSPALLRADRELQVKEQAGRWPWRQALADPVLPAAYARPPEPDAGRGPRWPRVHRGPIGSADRLVNDSAARDAIGRAHWILAVEMEGAGAAVAAHLHGRHWFVVRGVSDLGDEQKNDLWQGYAAMAAAAYTGALLGECRPLLDAVPVARRGVEGLGAIVDALLAIPAMRDDYQRRAVMMALPPRIRTTIPDNVLPRLHVLSMVETCTRFPDGHEALRDALRLALGEDTPDVQLAEEVLGRSWPGT